MLHHTTFSFLGKHNTHRLRGKLTLKLTVIKQLLIYARVQSSWIYALLLQLQAFNYTDTFPWENWFIDTDVKL
jgi:hypothetical protein